jgi:hypothetical protein
MLRSAAAQVTGKLSSFQVYVAKGMIELDA